MDASHEAVDQIIRISLQTGEVMLRLAGAGVQGLAALIAAAFKKRNGKPPKMTAGKRRLLKLLQSCRAEGARIESYPLKPKDSEEFKKLCKKYAVEYAAIHDKKNNEITILARESDAPRLNIIYEKLGYGKPEKDPARSVDVSEANPADIGEPEIKKNKASEQQFFRQKSGSNQSRPQTVETTTNTSRAEPSGETFCRRGPDLTDAQVIDVEFYEVPSVTAPPERLQLPAPENYIGINNPPPQVIYAGEPDGSAPGKSRKPNIHEKVYTYRAEMAKKKTQKKPQRAKTKLKPKAR